jgi:dihydroflavonol-4-reductase
MKIFITGATGFIGSRLINHLAQSGHELHCLVRKITPACEQLKTIGAKIIAGDVTDRNSLSSGMKGCDWVLHLAGLYSFWEPDNSRYVKINIDGTRNVMECAIEKEVSKIVHVSTTGIYGKPDDSPVTEESKPGPVRSCRYFQSKYEADQIVWDLHEKKGLPVVVVYPCSVLGPGDPKASGQYVADMINRRLPATLLPESILSFVHVRDVAEIIVRAAERENNTGEKYLVGKYHFTVRDLNLMISEISGVPLPKFKIPDFLVMTTAYFLTGFSNIAKIQPPWGMSAGQMKAMKDGFKIDGSKAERDLGIAYTPIRTAIEEAITAETK